ncbi:MAG: alpha-xylosidase [Clostridia bacterium]|nr:alpha-xylosidase [Clostridia bacterium]
MARFSVKSAPANEAQTFITGDVRLTVITDRILRVEKSSTGFCDRATQMVVCRDFMNVDYEIKHTAGGNIVVKTAKTSFRVNPKTARVEAAVNGKWTYPSNETNLGGTARTLDGTFGVMGSWKTKKEKRDRFFLGHMRKGIFSSNGVAEIDDSDSFLFNEDGSVSLRPFKVIDKYIFAFGDDYLGGLKEFYSLCGATPLLPKYALGNWWSRYHAYTQDEYINLMNEFEKHNIPLTVATIDMDWHIVKNVPKDVPATKIQGAGWTGYTFEESLFPDYKQFFKDLKAKGLAITMNLHPHDGVRYFEKQYADMCAAVGQDAGEKKPVKFNLTDEKFRDAYFDILHHPYEEDGVDFWWIDWQQGTQSPEMMGLDPLWLLNHYHTLDNCRGGRRGLILSRYAGIGSHRYPLGFSGDTFVCWKSLDFQPWFTSNASNAGYTWWSHDIGGHVMNSGNNELYLRWVQYGVFSPINRLHSNNTSISKEPWNFPDTEKIAEDFLRLRHRLLPYLYTANVLTAKEGIPLICPMYYYDKSDDARNGKYKNQYYFGGQMIVAPVTKPGKAGRANVDFYLPEGKWTDFFTHREYTGGHYSRECPLEEYPVFVKGGAIIPLLPEREGNSALFDELEVYAFAGQGSYTQYDEDGGSIDFTLNGEEITVTPSADCKTKKVTVIFVNSDKENQVFEF